MFFINLLQGFFCRAIQFKFHDIYEFVRLQNKVDAPFAYRRHIMGWLGRIR